MAPETPDTSSPTPPSPDDARSVARAPHPAGVVRVCVVFAALGLAAALPYVIPAELVSGLGVSRSHLDRLKAWRDGSPIPFTRFLDFRPPTRPRIAGVPERRTETPPDDSALLAAAQLPQPTRLPEAAPLTRGESRLRIAPEEYAGLTELIEDPAGDMAHFNDALADVARERPGAVARVLVYSDSINGSDRLTTNLRAMFSDRFGDAGKGWVPIRPGWQYQRHHDVVWEHGGSFRVRVVNRGEDASGRYGLGGVVAENRTPVAWATFGTVPEGPVGGSVSRFALFYQAWPEGGSVELEVDGGPAQRVSLSAAAVEDRVHEVLVPDGAHELSLRVAEGKARLYGVVMEREGPGVVVDGLMLVGAFTRVLLNFDEAHWARQLALREPDLIAFWLGGNDSVSDSVPFVRSRFLEDFPEVLRRARAGRPEASCLVLSAIDSAESVDGVVRSRRRVPEVVDAQREAASLAGCAFWNAYEAIGGSGTMRRWFHASPRLVTVDYRHPTPEGARVVATLLYKALLRGYDERLSASAPGAPPDAP